MDFAFTEDAQRLTELEAGARAAASTQQKHRELSLGPAAAHQARLGSTYAEGNR